MRARLSFGLSMAFKFDVYLIDELTSVGDMIFREKAKAAFEDIRKRASLIFVSHNLKTLKTSCQSALFLRDGQADYFPDINEGIRAYREYIRVQQSSKASKQSRRFVGKKNAAKRAARRLSRLEDPPEDQLPSH
jgi:ABC-type polysaccharide/polyol phosphate transport system ATPase subunit